MTDFIVTITEEPHLLGISAARVAYNASLPDVQDGDKVDGEGKPVMVPNPAQIKDDAAYMQMVGAGAAASYAKQYQTDVVEIDKEIAKLEVRRSVVVAAGSRP